MYLIKEEMDCGVLEYSEKVYIDNSQKAELEKWLIDSGFKKRDDGSFTRDLPDCHLTELFFFEGSDGFQDKKIRKTKDIKRDLEKYRVYN